MDKIINKNIDKREKLDSSIKSDLDSFYQGVDFNKLIDSPEDYLKDFSMQFLEIVLAEYAEKYISLGLTFGKEAKKKVIEYRSKKDLKQENENFTSD